MLTEWIYWVQTLSTGGLLEVIAVLMLIDLPRYTVPCVAIVIYDPLGDLWYFGRRRSVSRADYDCPSVAVLIAGHNEATTIESTLTSVCNTYPRMEIVVVDDGSSDGMAEAALRFTSENGGVRVLSRRERGGKSSALNWALEHTDAEIVVTIDADSQLNPGAIWEIVQPFRDNNVGAVSATLQA